MQTPDADGIARASYIEAVAKLCVRHCGAPHLELVAKLTGCATILPTAVWTAVSLVVVESKSCVLQRRLPFDSLACIYSQESQLAAVEPHQRVRASISATTHRHVPSSPCSALARVSAHFQVRMGLFVLSFLRIVSEAKPLPS